MAPAAAVKGGAQLARAASEWENTLCPYVLTVEICLSRNKSEPKVSAVREILQGAPLNAALESTHNYLHVYMHR